MTGAANPISITLPANCQGQITAESNASYLQRATFTIQGTNVVFSGTGEAKAMTTSSGATSYTFPPLSVARPCSVYFQYSTNNGNTWNTSVVNNPVTNTSGPFTTIIITSEDASDHDNNDTILTVFCYASS